VKGILATRSPIALRDCTAFARRHAAFAAQLFGERSALAVPRLVLHLRRPAVVVVSNSNPRVSWALRLYHRVTAPAASMRPAVRLVSIHRAAATRMICVTERQQQLSTRVLEYRRGGVPESHTPSAPQRSAAARPQPGTFPHLAMVLPRTSALPQRPAQTAPPASPPAAVATRQSVSPPAARESSISNFALPAQELSRLTDHVIRQLDRRVLSYRERNGKI